jgi:hypothetical protein
LLVVLVGLLVALLVELDGCGVGGVVTRFKGLMVERMHINCFESKLTKTQAGETTAYQLLLKAS